MREIEEIITYQMPRL